ncbi:ATP-dependent RNA helicase [Corynebacterium bovis]|uniref:ATP-dependent RNA helicase n=1 Tax=Corynebacterium bovis TaxID=36808 RepID=UPI000F64BD00|nr:ATP-dependent helicase C-terminal domain-containing protein [Corynebacterium bovis]RRQ14216.1 ATP-dependent helicase [Corynebacterium bovis]
MPDHRPDRRGHPRAPAATRRDPAADGASDHPADLPFAAGRDRLLAALRSHGAAVVLAPPGTGKTTLTPQYIADLVGPDQRVVVTQPRRVAARAAAARVADLRGGTVGDEVGYTVRGESAVGPRTRIEMVTPGVLLRRLLRDPDLPGVGAVVIDEIHERHLESDLVFAMVAQLRELRDDLLVAAMSATVDGERFAALLTPAAAGGRVAGGTTDASADPATPAPADAATPATATPAPAAAAAAVPCVEVPSPIHPLTVRYAAAEDSVTARDRRARPGAPGSVEDHVLRTVHRALAETSGDVLVFVPTIRATETLAQRLSGVPGVTAVPLHGRLSAAAQAEVVRGGAGAAAPGGSRGTGSPATGAATASTTATPRRVIVATDVAESSLTVPGVRVVVDSCLSRVARRETTRGMSVLVTEPVSKASSTQRAGRAGREGPGTVLRCVTADEWSRLPDTPPPAVRTSDLTGALLDVACWGSPGGLDLPLPDPFPEAAARAATETLVSLGAIDGVTAATPFGQVTELGRVLAGVPADPRLARGGLVALHRVALPEVARVLAVLDDGPREPDLTRAVAAVRRDDAAVRRFTRVLARADGDGAARVAAEADARTATAARRSADRTPGPDAAPSAGPGLTGRDAVGYVTACCLPETVARRVAPDGDRYLTVSGTAVVLPAGSPLAGSEWIVVADAARARTADGTGAVVRSAVAVPRDLALAAAGHRLVEETVTVYAPPAGTGADARGAATSFRLHARRVRRLGAVELTSTPVAPTRAQAREAVREAFRDHGAVILPWSDRAAALRRRIQFLHRAGEPGFPDVTDAGLFGRGGVDTPTGTGTHPDPDPVTAGVTDSALDDLAAGRRPDMFTVLRALLPWDRRIDDVAPESVELPGGRRARVTYPEVGDDGPPVVATRLQDCFGLDRSPVIAGRRIQFHLLSPAQRPLAVTDDLASFWAGPYREVRREMRGRYPKHPWPEDPAAGTA